MKINKMKVYCPYCKKEVEYNIDKREFKKFKGVDLNTYENVGVCKECKNDLFINELEIENDKRIYDLYRNKINIIKAQDIIDFRKKYDVSQRELTAILGFGKMTINRYENGGLPTKSQSDYMKVLIDNEDEFINKVKDAYSNKRISEKTYNKVISNKINNKNEDNIIQKFYRKYLNEELKRKPDIYNGYKAFDIEKVEDIISYIASKVNNLTITSVNKYLWFIDMISFNENTVSITGLTYQHEQFGPTIVNHGYDYIVSCSDKYKKNDYEDKNSTKTNITSNDNFDLNNIDENEKEIIDKVIDLLGDKTVTQISDLSHKEDGWKNTKMNEKISYEYAMNLKIKK